MLLLSRRPSVIEVKTKASDYIHTKPAEPVNAPREQHDVSGSFPKDPRPH